jgi:hypothetical protein
LGGGFGFVLPHTALAWPHKRGVRVLRYNFPHYSKQNGTWPLNFQHEEWKLKSPHEPRRDTYQLHQILEIIGIYGNAYTFTRLHADKK